MERSASAKWVRLLPAAVIAALAAFLLVLVSAAPAHADQIFYKTIGGAKYKISADYNEDRDDGPLGWQLEADYRGPVNKKKSSYTIPKTVKVSFRGKTRNVPVTEIDDKAFYKLVRLKKVTCKASIESIGDKAFYGCKNLVKFTSKAPITSIGDKAFYGCKKLTSVTAKPYRLREVGPWAFYNCVKLTSVPKLTAIEYGDDDEDDFTCDIKARAFCNCKSLKSVTVRLRSHRLNIGEGAFEKCARLEGVALEGSEGDVVVKARAFAGCQRFGKIAGYERLDYFRAKDSSFQGTPLYGKVGNIW